MINLIGNEIKKIFSKWSVKILIIIAVVFMIIQGIMMTFFGEDEYQQYYYDNLDEVIDSSEEYLSELDPNDPAQVELYVEEKALLETQKLTKKYKKEEEWKIYFIEENAQKCLQNLYSAKYGLTEVSVEEAQKEYDKLLETLEKNDWKQYVESELKKSQEELKKLQEEKNLIESKLTDDELKQLENTIALSELKVEVLKIRLEKNISYDNSNLNQALNTYENGMYSVLQSELNDSTKMSYFELQSLDEAKAESMIAKHMLDTGKILNDYNNSSATYNDYMINIADFIFILIIIVVTSSIVSDEFSKGTIKQLLVRPYKRTKIWLSKYISSIVVLIISILIIGIIAAVIFGLFMGFDDYANFEIGVYDYESGSAHSMNVFAYTGNFFISKLPNYIMLGTIAIFISTILKNAAMAVAVPLFGIMTSELINELLINSTKCRFLKYFITPHWDWSVYNFGKKSVFSFIDFKFSIIVYMIWFIVLIGLALFRFKKEDIKNI